MRQLLYLGWLCLACGPKVSMEADEQDEPAAQVDEERPCVSCVQLSCEAELEACAASSSCSCTAQCLESEPTAEVDEDPVFVCADRCGTLEDPQWRRLSQCGETRCGMCPASRADD